MNNELEEFNSLDATTWPPLPGTPELPALQDSAKDTAPTPPTQSNEDSEIQTTTEPACNICGETDWEFSIDHPPKHMSIKFNDEHPDFMMCCDECDVWYHVLCLDREEHGREPFDELVDRIERWPWYCPKCEDDNSGSYVDSETE